MQVPKYTAIAARVAEYGGWGVGGGFSCQVYEKGLLATRRRGVLTIGRLLLSRRTIAPTNPFQIPLPQPGALSCHVHSKRVVAGRAHHTNTIIIYRRIRRSISMPHQPIFLRAYEHSPNRLRSTLDSHGHAPSRKGQYRCETGNRSAPDPAIDGAAGASVFQVAAGVL